MCQVAALPPLDFQSSLVVSDSLSLWWEHLLSPVTTTLLCFSLLHHQSYLRKPL